LMTYLQVDKSQRGLLRQYVQLSVTGSLVNQSHRYRLTKDVDSSHLANITLISLVLVNVVFAEFCKIPQVLNQVSAALRDRTQIQMVPLFRYPSGIRPSPRRDFDPSFVSFAHPALLLESVGNMPLQNGSTVLCANESSLAFTVKLVSRFKP
jgi:hypothetical protein